MGLANWYATRITVEASVTDSSMLVSIKAVIKTMLLIQSRVTDQNGVSLLYIMLEIHQSGWEPSQCRPG